MQMEARASASRPVSFLLLPAPEGVVMALMQEPKSEASQREALTCLVPVCSTAQWARGQLWWKPCLRPGARGLACTPSQQPLPKAPTKGHWAHLVPEKMAGLNAKWQHQ